MNQDSIEQAPIELSSKQQPKETIIKSNDLEGGSSDEDLKPYKYDGLKSSSTSMKDMSTRVSAGATSETPIDMKDRQYIPRPAMKRFPLCIVWTPLPCFT